MNMEDYFIYAIVLLALFFILKKTFGKSGCGCPDFITFEKEHKTISNKPHG